MNDQELNWYILNTFGGDTVAKSFFTDEDFRSAKALAMEHIALMAPRDLATLPTLTWTDSVSLHSGENYYDLPQDCLRPLELFNGDTKITYYRPSLLFTRKACNANLPYPIFTLAGAKIYIYGLDPLPSEVSLLYIRNPADIGDFPLFFHEPVALYACFLLAAKVRGIWNGNPADIFQKFQVAMRTAMEEYTGHPGVEFDFMTPEAHFYDVDV